MIDKLISLLKAKSEDLNLFSAGDRLKLKEKHMVDALAVLQIWSPKKSEKAIDLGTGGGIPGLALAVSCPDVNFTLIDSCAKKVHALEEISAELKLKNVDFSCERIEEVAHYSAYRENFDSAFARAVAPLPTLLEYASGFLRAHGFFYAWKSADYSAELASSLRAQKELNLKFVHAFPYVLPEGEARVILVFKKTAKLSPAYPRGVGVPKGKPI
ncbi:MAG: 16S rRNA (guanine(527)-N(7))-methyltransferase RsmG [Candidatus Gracilibacteria bacterium]|jgi:16S rRNA (guanine527-N7)-methyltransferase